MTMDRRTFIRRTAAGVAGAAVPITASTEPKPFVHPPPPPRCGGHPFEPQPEFSVVRFVARREFVGEITEMTVQNLTSQFMICDECNAPTGGRTIEQVNALTEWWSGDMRFFDPVVAASRLEPVIPVAEGSHIEWVEQWESGLTMRHAVIDWEFSWNDRGFNEHIIELGNPDNPVKFVRVDGPNPAPPIPKAWEHLTLWE